MSKTPLSLLQMTGAPLQASAWSASVLLLIDCQNEYVDGALALPAVEAALEQIAQLCTAARAHACPIIHVRHAGRAGAPFDLQARRGAIAAQAAPVGTESVIDKSLPNAFAGTDLLTQLQASGRKELIVAGFMTHMCISSTVRAALDLGYRSTVVANATATRDLPGPDGATLAAADLQYASLAALADRFAIIAAGVNEIPQ